MSNIIETVIRLSFFITLGVIALIAAVFILISFVALLVKNAFVATLFITALIILGAHEAMK